MFPQKNLACKGLTLNIQGLSNLTGQYHGCWCPGSFRRQGISTHEIGY